MEKEFLDYTEALALKELGFDEPCFAYYDVIKMELDTISSEVCERLCKHDTHFKAPTFSQAFRWFREKYFIHGEPLYKGGLTSQTAWYNYDIISTIDWDDSKVKNKQYKTYEEAELACLEKLIEIVKEKQL
jgi:hypothetical protein